MRSSQFIFFVLTASFIVGISGACQRDRPNNAETEDKNMQGKFIGNWELREWTAQSIEGDRSYPFGQDALGRITYDKSGKMAVQIMKNDRNPFFSDNPLEAQPEEMAAAFDDFIAYTGDFEVDTASRQVVHKIRISSFPNWVGRDQVRNFKFSEENLILSTPLIGSHQHQLVWVRAD